MEGFDAVKESGGGGEFLAAADGGVEGLIGVVVCVDLRLIAKEHEEIAMAAEGEADFGFLSESLFDAGEPGLGVFPGRVVAVELIRAEGVVHIGEVEGAVAEIGGEAGGGEELEVAVIAIGLEAGGEIAGEGEFLGEFLADDAEGDALLIDASVAERGAEAQFGGGGGRGDDVDDAADGVRTVEGGAGAAHDFDAVDVFQGRGDIHVGVAGLGIVEAHAVEEDEGLAEAGAADGEIGLDAVGGALLKVERGIEAEQIGEAVEDEGLGSGGEDADGAIDLFERHGLERTGDDDGIALLLGESDQRGNAEEKEISEGQLLL